MNETIIFLLFSPVGVPAWVFLIAWLAFKLNVFWFLDNDSEINHQKLE